MVTLVIYPNKPKTYLENANEEMAKYRKKLQHYSNFVPSQPQNESHISSTVKNNDLKITKWVNFDTVIIVANGQSASQFKAPPDVPVIAVNSAVQWLDRWDWFFTLDPSKKNLNNFQVALEVNKRSGGEHTKAVFALPDMIVIPNTVKYPTAHIMTRLVGEYSSEPQDENSPEWWLWRYKAKLGLTTHEGGISTGNSAYGALNLAYHIGFKTAVLIGIDGTQTLGMDGDEPQNLSHLPLLFKSAAKQINIVNCGSLKGFAHTDFDVWYANFKDRS